MSLAKTEVPPLREKLTADPNEQYFRTDHLLGDLHGRSFRGGVVTLSSQGVKLLLGIISTVALARLLQPEDFGLVAMVSALTGFIGIWGDLGLSTATVQRKQITHDQVSVLFWINCATSLGITLLTVALSPVIAWFYHEPRLISITIVSALAYLFGGLTAQQSALLRRQMRFQALAARDIVGLATGVATGITMAFLGCGYWSLIGMRLGQKIAATTLLWTASRWRPGKFKRGVGAKSLITFGGNLTAAGFLNCVTRNIDNVLVGRVLGATAIGIYSKAYGLLMLPMGAINGPMGAVMIPALSRLQHKPVEYRKLYFRAVGAISLATIPLVVFAFFFAKDVVLVMLGEKWSPVARVFQFLGPAALVMAVTPAANWLCISLDRTRTQLQNAMLSAPVCVLAFLIGIRWGTEGMAAGASVAFTALFGAFVWRASKNSPVGFFQVIATIVSTFVPACIAGISSWMFRQHLMPHAGAVAGLLTGFAVFAVVYLGGIMTVRANRDLVKAGLKAARASVQRMRKR